MISNTVDLTHKVPALNCMIYAFFVVIASQFLLWGDLLELTFGEGLILFSIIVTDITIVTFNVCEVNSFIPFFGGSYGLIRLALGPYYGFLVGIVELIQLVLMNTIMLYGCGDIISKAVNLVSNEGFIFAIYVAMLIVAFFPFCLEFKHYFVVKVTFGVMTCIIYFFIVFGIIEHFEELPEEQMEVVHTADFLMEKVKQPYWFYFVLSIMPILNLHTEKLKRDSPKITITALVIAVIVSFISFLFMKLAYGNRKEFPLVVLMDPFTHLAEADYSQDIYDKASVVTIIPLTFCLMTFTYAQARTLSAMADSGFIFSFLSLDSDGLPKKVTFFILLIFTLIVACFSFVSDYFLSDIFHILVFGSYVTYSLQMASFFVFRTKFSSLQRGFKSPFGIYGAALGVILNLYLAFCTIYYNDRYGPVLITYGSIIVFSIFMYAFYIRKYQKFSDLEQKTMFAAYVINANQMKNQKKKLKKIDTNSYYYRFINHMMLLYKIFDVLSNPFRETFNFGDQSLDSDFISLSSEHSNSQSKSNSKSQSKSNQVGISDFDIKETSVSNTNRSDTSKHRDKPPPPKIDGPSLSSLLLQFFCCVDPPDAPIDPSIEKDTVSNTLKNESILSNSRVNYIPSIYEDREHIEPKEINGDSINDDAHVTDLNPKDIEAIAQKVNISSKVLSYDIESSLESVDTNE